VVVGDLLVLRHGALQRHDDVAVHARLVTQRLVGRLRLGQLGPCPCKL
jgi:hypothetical protein